MFGISRQEAERRLSKILPPLLYCALEERLRLLMNPARRGGPERRTGRDALGLFVEWEGGERFYFNHPFLHNRYVWPDGVDAIRGLLLDKYQDGDVRLQPGEIVVEAGAMVGEFTTAAAAIAGQVYSFEPDPVTYRYLTRNTQALGNVQLFHAGLGDFEGAAELFMSRANADSSFLAPRDRGDQSVTVQITTIASLMASKSLDKVDFLKVEAEGLEPEILAGAGDRLKDIEKVAVDCGPERYGADTYEECESLLKAAHFRTWRRPADWMLFARNEATCGQG